MLKKIFCVSQPLPAKTPETEKSIFKPVNALVSTFMEQVMEQVEKKVPSDPDIRETAAFQAFEKGLIEFLNNSADKKANEVVISCTLDGETNTIKISISDNGSGVSSTKAGKYDWRKALLTPSEAATNGMPSSGQHLGLSTIAYFLERQQGSLLLEQNSPEKGAVVILTSSLKKCGNFDQPKSNMSSIVEEMLFALLDGKSEENSQSILREIENKTTSKTIQGAIKAVSNKLSIGAPAATPEGQQSVVLTMDVTTSRLFNARRKSLTPAATTPTTTTLIKLTPFPSTEFQTPPETPRNDSQREISLRSFPAEIPAAPIDPENLTNGTLETRFSNFHP